jgi:hypothetical protein
MEERRRPLWASWLVAPQAAHAAAFSLQKKHKFENVVELLACTQFTSKQVFNSRAQQRSNQGSNNTGVGHWECPKRG